MSIRLCLTLWYTAILFVALAAFAFAIGWQLNLSQRNDLDTTISGRARETAAQITVLARGASRSVFAIPDEDSLDNIARDGDISISIVNLLTGEIVSQSYAARLSPLSMQDLATLRDGHGGYQTVQVPKGERMRVYKLGVQVLPDVPANVAVITEKSTAVIDAAARRTVLLLTGGTLGATLLLALIVYAVAENALRPLSRMARDAARIQRAQDLSRQVRVPNTRDEVAALGRTFNDMLGRLDAVFESQRRFIADASHELRTPLTAIRGNADIMRQLGERMDSDERIEVLDEVAAEAERMSRLVNDLLTLARAQAGEQVQPRPVRLNDALESAVRAARGLARGHSILYTSVDAAFWVTGDPDRLKQLMLILLDNAVKYTPPDGHIWVWMRPVGQLVEVRVADDGPGIPGDRLPHLFERFYRGGTPARGRDDGGAGLGLAIAQEIAQTFEGTISVESSVGHGTAFVVRFPVIAGSPDDEPVEQAAATSPEPVTIVSL